VAVTDDAEKDSLRKLTEDADYRWYQAPQVDTPEEAILQWDNFRRRAVQLEISPLMNSLRKSYSTSQAAEFLGRSNQWLYWGLRNHIFTYSDGTPIEPEWTGERKLPNKEETTAGKRRFTLPIIKEIAFSCHRRGNLSEKELKAVMAKILLAEFGPEAFSGVYELD